MPAQNVQKQAGGDFNWEGMFESQNDYSYPGAWNAERADTFMDYQFADLDLNTFMSLDDMGLPFYEPFTSALTASREHEPEQHLERRRSSNDALEQVEQSQRNWFASTYQNQPGPSHAGCTQKEVTFVNESDKYFKKHRASTGSIRMADVQGTSTIVSSSHFLPVHSGCSSDSANHMNSDARYERRRSAPDASVCLLTCPWNGCNKAFGRMYNLKSHYRTHTKDKPFGCAYCPQFFARNHDLKRHQRTHSSEKQFVCPVCVRKFSRSDALHRHRSAGSCFKRTQIE